MRSRRIKSSLITPPEPTPVATGTDENGNLVPIMGQGVTAEELARIRASMATAFMLPGHLLSQGPRRSLSGYGWAAPEAPLAPRPGATFTVTDEQGGVRISMPSAENLETTDPDIHTRSISSLPGGESTIEGDRIDPLTGMSISICMRSGPYFHNDYREIAALLDYGMLALAHLRHRTTDQETSLSLLRLDVFVRMIYPHEHERLMMMPARSAIRWLAGYMGYTQMTDVPDYPGGTNDPERDDHYADLIIHHFISLVCAGRWGTF